jgi:hypothetical protein
MAAPTDVIAEAYRLFELGYQIVAVRADKRPWGRDWRRPHTIEEVVHLLEGSECVAIGFLGGELNYWLVPFDFDRKIGEDWFRARCLENSIDPDDYPTVLTSLRTQPDGTSWRGRHRYMSDIRHALGNSAGPVLTALGIDIRGNGMTILPPSPHASGIDYEWATSHSLTDFTDGIPSVPDFLYDAILERGQPAGEASQEDSGAMGGGEPLPHGDPPPRGPQASYRPHTAPPPPNEDARAEAYCRGALENARARLAAAPQGQRNAALNNEALGLAHLAHYGVFSEGEALSQLMAACDANGLLADSGVKACHATFHSGWRKGLDEPRFLDPAEVHGTSWKQHQEHQQETKREYHRERQENQENRQEQGENQTGRQTGTPDEGIGEWDAGDNEGQLPPPRGWLLGNVFCRQYVSSLFAAGGVGKTAVRIAQALALSSGQPITGEHIFLRARVLYVCLEDDRDELLRRIIAAMKHHDLGFADIRGWLFLATPALQGWRLAHIEERQAVEGELGHRLEATIRRRQIDIVFLDPFIKSHAVEENDNNKIDFVANILAQIAYRNDCAFDAPHHISKGGADPGNAEKGRGASAFKDAVRLGYTLTTMTAEEAEILAISDVERRSLVRMDSAKVNIAPPLEQAKWFRLVGVSLGNTTETYPHGDEVQTVEPWEPPSLWGDISPAKAREILLAIDKGLEDGRRYSNEAPAKDDIAAWCVVRAYVPGLNKKQGRAIIKGWLESGVLVKETYHNPITRFEAKGLKVVYAKMPGGKPDMGARTDEF